MKSEQADYYSLFIVSNSSETLEQKVKSEQRDNGHWNTDVADLLPSAISNFFNAQLKDFLAGIFPT